MAFKIEELLEDSPDQEWVERCGTARYLANLAIVVPLVLEGKPYAPLEYAHMGGFQRRGVDAAWFRELQRTLQEHRLELSDKITPPAQNDVSMGRYGIFDRDRNQTFYMVPSASRHGKQFSVEDGIVKECEGGIAVDFQYADGKVLTIQDLKRGP